MTCEIDRDFYCTDAEGFISSDGTSVLCAIGDRFCGTCKNMRRKWPTPEQFKEEYGGDLAPAFPVWLLIQNDPSHSFNEWTLMEYAEALQYEREAEEADCTNCSYCSCVHPLEKTK